MTRQWGNKWKRQTYPHSQPSPTHIHNTARHQRKKRNTISCSSFSFFFYFTLLSLLGFRWNLLSTLFFYSIKNSAHSLHYQNATHTYRIRAEINVYISYIYILYYLELGGWDGGISPTWTNEFELSLYSTHIDHRQVQNSWKNKSWLYQYDH